jgi:hypothetical protein
MFTLFALISSAMLRLTDLPLGKILTVENYNQPGGRFLPLVILRQLAMQNVWHSPCPPH